MPSVGDRHARSALSLLCREMGQEAPAMSAHETFGLKRILCATDFSVCSAAALRAAVALARGAGGEVRVLHVSPFAFSSAVLDLPYLPPAGLTAASRRPELLQKLRDFTALAGVAGVDCRYVLREGDPAEQILHELAAAPADLVTVGRYSRGVVDRWILGSVSEYVVRSAGTPVLVVPEGFSLSGSGAPVRLLCAVGLDDGSRATVDYAASLARTLRADLSLLHVVDSVEEEPWGGRSPVDVAEYRDIMAYDARARLALLAPNALLPEACVERRVVRGESHKQILKAVEETRPEILVMGWHSSGTLLGSTVRHALRRAACPVLVVPTAPVLRLPERERPVRAAQ
jgi:nucleotide-binding universal stress UspA family protein